MREPRANDSMAKVNAHPRRVRLKDLAAHLHLSPSTISYVLNDTPGRSIAEETRERIRAAADEFNYKPNTIARSLLRKPMPSIGILLPVLGTTIRQPLKLMGRTAAAALLRRLADEDLPATIQVEPRLVVRASSGAAPRAA